MFRSRQSGVTSTVAATIVHATHRWLLWKWTVVPLAPTGWSGTLSSHCISVGDSPAICAGNHSESSGAACDEMTCRLAMLPVKLNRITIHWTHWRAPSPNITSTSSWYDPASCCRAQPAMTVRLYAQRTDVPMHSAAPSAKPACWKACGGEHGA